MVNFPLNFNLVVSVEKRLSEKSYKAKEMFKVFFLFAVFPLVSREGSGIKKLGFMVYFLRKLGRNDWKIIIDWK